MHTLADDWGGSGALLSTRERLGERELEERDEDEEECDRFLLFFSDEGEGDEVTFDFGEA